MKDNTNPETTPLSREHRVSAIAYQLWEEEGRPEGRAEVHWHIACEMIDAEDAASEEPLPAWLNKAEDAPKPQAAAEVNVLRKKSAA